MTVKDKNHLRFAAPMALAMGLGLCSAGAMSGDMDYVGAASGFLKDASGVCVQSLGPHMPQEACGDMVAQPAMDSDGDGVADSEDRCPGTPAGVEVDSEGCPLDSDGDGVPDYKDKCPGTPAGTQVDANGCAVMGAIVINLPDDEFDFDSAELKPAMKAALDDVAAQVKARGDDVQLLVVGHTDSTGPEAYNQMLSERRAQSAAGYLIENGVDAANVSTKGMGESQPIADNATKEGRAMNRRVEILVQ